MRMCVTPFACMMPLPKDQEGARTGPRFGKGKGRKRG
jgi:hypothetical protein